MSRSATPSVKTPIGYPFMTDRFGDLVSIQGAGLSLDEDTARASVEAQLRAEGKFVNLNMADPKAQATLKRSVTRRMNSMKEEWRHANLPKFNKREWRAHCKAMYQAVSDIINMERLVEKAPSKRIELNRDTYEIKIRNSIRIIKLPTPTTIIDRSWVSAMKNKIREEIRVLIPALAGIRAKREPTGPRRRLIGSPYRQEVYDWIISNAGNFGVNGDEVKGLIGRMFQNGYLWLPTLAPKSIFRAWIDANPEFVDFSESMSPKTGNPTKVFRIKSSSPLGRLIRTLDPSQSWVKYDDQYIREVYVNALDDYAPLVTDRGLLSLNPILTAGISKEEKKVQPVPEDLLRQTLSIFSIKNRRPRTPVRVPTPPRASVRVAPRSPRARVARA